MKSRALFLADVDGTLVTPEKVLTPRALRAVHALQESEVAFSIVSGRPPRGLKPLAEQLKLAVPFAAFNGAAIVEPDLKPIRERKLDTSATEDAIRIIGEYGLDCWLYSGHDWYIRDPQAAHVAKETHTVQFEPIVVKDFSGCTEEVLKVVGVSDDHPRVASCEAALQKELGERASATRSQPYYVDVTHPEANKGTVIRELCDLLNVALPNAVTIGDMPNDILMFKASGFSIAMGNAGEEVKKAADYVTSSNREEGFAEAVDYLLRSSRRSSA